MVVHEQRIASLNSLDGSSNLRALGGIIGQSIPIIRSHFAIKVRAILRDWDKSFFKTRNGSGGGCVEMDYGLDVRAGRIDGIMDDIRSDVSRAVNQILRHHLVPHLPAGCYQTSGAESSRNMVPNEHIHAVLGRETMGDREIVSKCLLLGLAPFIRVAESVVVFDDRLDFGHESLTDSIRIGSIMREDETVLDIPQTMIFR
mmetsp:Transcript_21563/g.61815  ORF Transcript_21563/g.61815 Transcript_21563/m.61815 type:complete len:201 (+) Transcript_21563:339-941(+)